MMLRHLKTIKAKMEQKSIHNMKLPFEGPFKNKYVGRSLKRILCLNSVRLVSLSSTKRKNRLFFLSLRFLLNLCQKLRGFSLENVWRGGIEEQEKKKKRRKNRKGKKGRKGVVKEKNSRRVPGVRFTKHVLLQTWTNYGTSWKYFSIVIWGGQ